MGRVWGKMEQNLEHCQKKVRQNPASPNHNGQYHTLFSHYYIVSLAIITLNLHFAT